MPKLKGKSTPECADIYLKALLEADNKNQIPPFVGDVFDPKRIYYDQDVVDNMLELLLKREFIEVVPDSVSLKLFPKNKEEAEIYSQSPERLLEQIDFSIKQYRLTRKGYRFVSSNQKLFKPNYAILFKEAWQSNRITVSIYLITTIALSLIGLVVTIVELLEALGIKN